MKHPTARQLPSGNWFCRVMVNGESINITESTQAKAEAKALAIKARAEKAKKKKAPAKITLSDAIDKYIKDRSAVLSPSTLLGYRGLQRQRFKKYMQRPVSWFTPDRCQKMVNEEAQLISAKTLKNAWGLVEPVLHDQTGERIEVRLPQVVKKDLPWFTPDQCKIFQRAIRGTKVEAVALLAMSSLRRSEVLSVCWSDIRENSVTVHGATVQNEQREFVEKEENKNESSRRVIPFCLPGLWELAQNASDQSAHVVTVYPGTLRRQVNRICEKEGLPLVGMHGLRRSYASICWALGIDARTAAKVGGWKDVTTMNRIYVKLDGENLSKQMQPFKDFFDADRNEPNK